MKKMCRPGVRIPSDLSRGNPRNVGDRPTSTGPAADGVACRSGRSCTDPTTPTDPVPGHRHPDHDLRGRRESFDLPAGLALIAPSLLPSTSRPGGGVASAWGRGCRGGGAVVVPGLGHPGLQPTCGEVVVEDTPDPTWEGWLVLPPSTLPLRDGRGYVVDASPSPVASSEVCRPHGVRNVVIAATRSSTPTGQAQLHPTAPASPRPRGAGRPGVLLGPVSRPRSTASCPAGATARRHDAANGRDRSVYSRPRPRWRPARRPDRAAASAPTSHLIASRSSWSSRPNP